ncbi:MAG: hypothetical protein WAL97_05165 [Halobacteriota archaeon]
MTLCKFIKDANGYQRGRYQFFDERQADFLIKKGICVEANNGDHIEGEPTKRDLFMERVDALREKVSTLYTFVTISELEPRLSDACREYDDLARQGDWPHRPYDLQSLNKQAARLLRLETQAEDVKKQLDYWSRDGVGRETKVIKLAADRERARGQLASPNDHERQLGAALLNGIQKEYQKIEILYASLEAQLKALTG